MPGEMEKAAALLGMSSQEFFDKYLVADFWAGDDPDFVLAPAVTHMIPGREAGFVPIGTCVFYDGERCRIHTAKPYECRMYSHEVSPDEAHDIHIEALEAWQTEDMAAAEQDPVLMVRAASALVLALVSGYDTNP